MRHSFRKCKTCGTWRYAKETCPCTTPMISLVAPNVRPVETVNATSISACARGCEVV